MQLSRSQCRTGVVVAWICYCLTLSGCASMATRRAFYQPVEQAVANQQFPTALAQLRSSAERGKFASKDRLLYYLDAGYLSYYCGEYDSALVFLHQAESTADELFTKSISTAAASLLLNDNALAYAGEDYELVYVNLIKALCYLSQGKFDDALVEIRRVNLRLEGLTQKYGTVATMMQAAAAGDSTHPQLPITVDGSQFSNSAFARLLGLLLFAADGRPDDARIAHDQLTASFVAQPNLYPFQQPTVDRLERSDPPLTIIALVGRAPRKESFTLRLRTDKELDLVQVLTTDSDGNESEYGHFPLPVSEDYYFKFAIPRLVDRPSEISSIRVGQAGREAARFSLLEDVSLIAHDSFRARSSLVYVRTLARAIVKGLATHKLKKKADTGGFEGWLKKAAIDVGADLTEAADLRSSQFLPGKIYVAQVPYNAADSLSIEYYDAGNLLVDREAIQPVFIGRRQLPLATIVRLQ